jgi:hypothetical protein
VGCPLDKGPRAEPVEAAVIAPLTESLYEDSQIVRFEDLCAGFIEKGIPA